MKLGQLRDHFVGVGVKRLSAVDADPKKSNQHEIGINKDMLGFLGENRRSYQVLYIWLGDNQDGFSVEGTATHYDTRENVEHKTAEWRLYYLSNTVTGAMQEGDTLFLAKHNDGQLYFIVAPEGSTSEHQLHWLFGLQPSILGKNFVSREFLDDGPELDFAARYILDQIGIEFENPEADEFEKIISRFDTTFPDTTQFSNAARLALPEVRAEDDPDAALLAWLAHEEAMFRCLEKRVISRRLEDGFSDGDKIDVDSFIRFSLSVHNRRKSRMGYSLENHLEAVFKAFGIKYDRGKVTENHHRPDFLFPSVEAYHAAPATGSADLAMLGAKSTCKDRWRQVLAEAAKIHRKHLLTLEPGISETQTEQMAVSHLQLIVPEGIQDSYTEKQRKWLWNLAEFVQYLGRM